MSILPRRSLADTTWFPLYEPWLRSLSYASVPMPEELNCKPILPLHEACRSCPAAILLTPVGFPYASPCRSCWILQHCNLVPPLRTACRSCPDAVSLTPLGFPYASPCCALYPTPPFPCRKCSKVPQLLLSKYNIFGVALGASAGMTVGVVGLEAQDGQTESSRFRFPGAMIFCEVAFPTGSTVLCDWVRSIFLGASRTADGA